MTEKQKIAASCSPTSEVLLEVNDLTVEFAVRRSRGGGRAKQVLRAVDGVSLKVHRGETLGLVGESGSGKTTLGRALLRAVPASRGSVRFHGQHGGVDEVMQLDRRGLRRVWRNMQMIFQDPFSSLNPRMTVRDIIGEPLVAHGLAKGVDLESRIRNIAIKCGLSTEQLGRHPHAFSGGQRQRIAIARALILDPEFVVCDEAVSALDVSIQAQILNLLKRLQRDLELTYLFIAHDLAVVSQVSDRVAVMYLGRIIETGPTARLFNAPRHPYTEALLSAIPTADPDKPMNPVLLTGERPDPSDPPGGCAFHTRCRFAQNRCREEKPALKPVGSGHLAACHFTEELELHGVLQQDFTRSAL
ncbi:MAG: oligopeptide/dipeptide ABC transporter ATP-binding protein [Trueperaceae bacterium]